MKRHDLYTLLLFLVPGLFLLIFFVVPLLNAVAASFELPNANLTHYQRLIDVPFYRVVYFKTIRVALLATVLSLALAYPCAYYVSRLSSRARLVVVTLVALPFMLSA